MTEEKSLKQASKIVFQEGKKVAWILSTNPTENEIKFQSLLNQNHIKYRFQKVFFKSYEGTKKTAECYYIAQFWLYKKKLFVEIPSGSRAKVPRVQDFRIYKALEVFPKAQSIQLTADELEDPEFIDNFINLIK